MTTVLPSTDKIPDFEGEPVDYVTLKFSGVGTGFSDGLKVAPVVMHIGDEAFFVFRGTVASVDHCTDKDEITFRRHDMRIVDMAPVSPEIAKKALEEYAAEVDRLKNEAKGQAQLDLEKQAEAKEAND